MAPQPRMEKTLKWILTSITSTVQKHLTPSLHQTIKSQQSHVPLSSNSPATSKLSLPSCFFIHTHSLSSGNSSFVVSESECMLARLRQGHSLQTEFRSSPYTRSKPCEQRERERERGEGERRERERRRGESEEREREREEREERRRRERERERRRRRREGERERDGMYVTREQEENYCISFMEYNNRSPTIYTQTGHADISRKNFVIRWDYVNLCLFKRKKSTRIPLSLLAL